MLAYRVELQLVALQESVGVAWAHIFCTLISLATLIKLKKVPAALHCGLCRHQAEQK